MEEIFVIGITVLAVLTTVWGAWRAGGDDPLRDLRWRALEPDDRARLPVAGLAPTSTAALADPEERALAEGFGRRERRRRAYVDLALPAILALVAALALAGLLDASAFGLVLVVYLLASRAVESLRNRQIKRGMGRVPGGSEPDAATAR